MKRIFLICLLLASFAAPAAQAQENETTTPGMKSHTVTSVEACLEKLDEEDAIDVRTRYMKSWQECQKRLEVKLARERAEKAAEKAEKAPKDNIPETPRNYIRVQKSAAEMSAQKEKESGKKEKKAEEE